MKECNKVNAKNISLIINDSLQKPENWMRNMQKAEKTSLAKQNKLF
jgi:hypothetical protein